VTRNRALSGTGELELLDGLVSSLHDALPADWTVIASRNRRSGDREADMLLRLAAPDGAAATVLVEVKRSAEPRDLPSVLRQIWRSNDAFGADAVIFVTSFVSPLTRDGLAEAGVGWFDATGNLRLRVNRPAVFVDRVGADRNPFTDPTDRQLKSLRGPAAARIVRALCEVELPLGVRSFATHAGAANGSSSRVLNLLSREGLVERDDLGRVLSVRKQSLVRRWTQDYGLITSNEVTPVLDPRGLDHATAMLRSTDIPHAISGSAAARAYLPAGMVPVAPLTTLALHTRQPADLIQAVGLHRVERGANVLVVRPFDDVLAAGTRTVDGLRCVAPAQVVADLLTGPGRSSEEAEQLIRVLALEDKGWIS
jgi:hypothetical protein